MKISSEGETGFLQKFGPVKNSRYMVHHHIGNWSSVYILPTIVLPIQQVGFNCDNFPPEGYKRKNMAQFPLHVYSPLHCYTIVQILYTVMCK